jgi:peptidoglycan/LPS O-acetylase OafA/YrhL
MHQRRLDYIDTLRGLAAVAVIIYHLRLIAAGAPLATPAWMVNVTDRILEGGVPLFFAISGFLLTMLMPSYERHRHPTASFYAKRFFRIAPLFYTTILLWAAWATVLPPLGKLIANVTFTFNLIPWLADSVIFAGWTIGVEMLFYLVFPLLYPRLPGITLKLAALVASLVTAATGDSAIIGSGLEPRFSFLTFSHSLPLFFVGMIAFDLSVLLKAHPKARELGILLLAGSALVFDLIVTRSTVLVPERYWQGLACGMILLAFAIRPFTIANPVTAFVGRISYSMYLLHGLLIVLLRHAFLAPYRWGLPPALAFPVDVLMALVVIVPVSWVAYALVEVPGNRLGGITVRWLDDRPEGAVWFGRKFVRGVR